MHIMKKIYILTETFPPRVSATGSLLDELAYRLSKEFSIEVITSIANKTKKTEKQGTNGEPFYNDGKKRFSIKRMNSFVFNKNNKAGRVFNGLLFFIKTFFYLTGVKSDSFLLIVSNPPFLPLLGLLFFWLRKQPFFYLVHDLYPEIAVNLGYLKERSLLTRLWKKLNSSLFTSARKIIFLGEQMAKRAILSYPAIQYHNNYEVIPNWSNREVIFPQKDKKKAKAACSAEGKFIVQYSGNIGLFHNTRVLIETADRLKEYPDILFFIIGRGGAKKELMTLAKEKGLANVIFKDFVDQKQLNTSLNSADAAVITLDSRAVNLCVPSKFYTIIAAGLPVVGIMDKTSDIGREIAGNPIGYVVPPEDLEGICRAILELYEDRKLREQYAQNARSYFLSRYDICIIQKMYTNLFKNAGRTMIDLHSHTSASDGLLRPEKLIIKAKNEGLKAIAITDHDTVDGIEEAAKMGVQCNVEVIPGIELSCYHGEIKQEIHMLGLFIDPSSKVLLTLLEELHKYRYKRNVDLLANLKANDILLTEEELLADCNKTLYNVGKPNIARLIHKKGYTRNENEAMKKYLDDNKGLAKTEKIKISSKQAINTIHQAGGLAILAHPSTMDYVFDGQDQLTSFVGELAELGLDGIEVFYHGYKKNRVKHLKKIASMYNLIKSGGSDFHSERGFRTSRLGFYGVKKNIPPEILDNLKKRL